MPHSHAFRTACPSCDWLLDIPALAPGTAAACARCGTRITSVGRNSIQIATACSVSAILLLMLSLSIEFLSLERLGFANQISILQIIAALYKDGAAPLAAFIGFMIIIAPMLLLCGQLLLFYLLFSNARSRVHGTHANLGFHLRNVKVHWGWGRRAPRISFAMAICRIRHSLMHWSMVEVFLIGALVSLVKLLGMARVEIGFGFWCFCGFVLCFVAAFNLVDKHQLWYTASTQDDIGLNEATPKPSAPHTTNNSAPPQLTK